MSDAQNCFAEVSDLDRRGLHKAADDVRRSNWPKLERELAAAKERLRETVQRDDAVNRILSEFRSTQSYVIEDTAILAQKAADALAECQARAEGAREDAERYRWLRNRPDTIDWGHSLKIPNDATTWEFGDDRGKLLDAAIDAAMKEREIKHG